MNTRHIGWSSKVAPIHEKLGPVRAYAKLIAAEKAEPFDVVEIPVGSSAWSMGYRFVSIQRTERDYYLSHGAKATGGKS